MRIRPDQFTYMLNRMQSAVVLLQNQVKNQQAQIDQLKKSLDAIKKDQNNSGGN